MVFIGVKAASGDEQVTAKLGSAVAGIDKEEGEKK